MNIEEVIARAIVEFKGWGSDLPSCRFENGKLVYKKSWEFDGLPETRAILSALKAAGLVIVPEEPTGEMIYELWGPYLSTSAHQARLNGYRAMIRAATSPDAPGTVLGSPHD